MFIENFTVYNMNAPCKRKNLVLKEKIVHVLIQFH
jgi:hypothetical protein